MRSSNGSEEFHGDSKPIRRAHFRIEMHLMLFKRGKYAQDYRNVAYQYWEENEGEWLTETVFFDCAEEAEQYIREVNSEPPFHRWQTIYDNHMRAYMMCLRFEEQAMRDGNLNLFFKLFDKREELDDFIDFENDGMFEKGWNIYQETITDADVRKSWKYLEEIRDIFRAA